MARNGRSDKTIFTIILLLSSLCCPLPSLVRAAELPAIAIIIDDLGYTPQRDKWAISLPGAVTCAFLPNSPHASEMAALAHRMNKEVMIHLPMQAIANEHQETDAITLDTSQKGLRRILWRDLKTIPHAVGLNNHMGSLVTQHPGHMQWLMEELRMHGLYFVDSYTTKKSVVQTVANENWVPNIRRDIFLDNVREHGAINRQFDRLLRLARKNGIALAIGHPYPQTLTVLNKRLRRLAKDGYRLVPVSQLIKINLQRVKTWRAFLSP